VRRAPVPVGVLAIVIVLACGSPAPTPSPAPSAARTPPPSGGVLKVGMNIAEFESFQRNDELGFDRSWDPQFAFSASAFEVYRCCLVRTLMAYNGRSSSEGGAELRPDVARDYPDISADGLTWTFHLTEGLKYAPPFADTEIVAADFVRSIERDLRPDPMVPDGPQSFGPYANYLSELIVGAEDYTFKGASRISGLETPDEHTLVIHLLEPAGDLGARLAMSAFGPLPAGAADGLDSGYGRHLVASGPYMVEGSDQVDPAVPAAQQPPVSGYIPGVRLNLVRNPSWQAATDALRSAASDRIEITQLDESDFVDALRNDAVDVTLELYLDPEAVPGLRADPQVSDRLYVKPFSAADWVMLNVAQAPFDDVHIRRAVNLAFNRQTMVDTLHPGALPLHHAIPDAFENDLLRDYNPYATERDAGSVVLAMDEVRQSAYDANGDGICDAEACAHVPVPIREDFPEVWIAAQLMASAFEPLGIHLELTKVPVEDFFNQAFDPANHSAMVFTFGWGSDYLNGSAWFGPLARGAALEQSWGANLSRLGASADQLSEWGFQPSSVPSLDAKIAACSAATGQAQFECWAQADQYLMERVVPWIPIDVRANASLTSSRVQEMVFDASTTTPSLGEIVVSH
jgi:peptide/nickel transport system substrate-binding protein